MNLPFFRCKSICTGGGPESGRKKYSKNAFRLVPVQKFTFPATALGLWAGTSVRDPQVQNPFKWLKVTCCEFKTTHKGHIWVIYVICESLKSENSRRLWLFLGSLREFWRKVPGKFRENCWKKFPESPNATNSRISCTGKGKPRREPWVHTAGTLSPPSLRGVFRNRQFQPSRVFW